MSDYLEDFYDFFSWSQEEWMAFFRWLDADDGEGAKAEWEREDERIRRQEDGWKTLLAEHYELAGQYSRRAES